MATMAFALSALGWLGCTVGPSQEDPNLGVLAADCRTGYGGCKDSCEKTYPKNETLRKECERSCKSQYCTLTCETGYVVQDGRCVLDDSGSTPDAGTIGDPVIVDAAPDASPSGGSSTTVPSPLPTPRSGLAVVTGSDGRIYAIGGSNGSTVMSTVEAYSVVTNTWTTVAPMPTPRTGLAAVLGPDGRIYAIGGMNGDPTQLLTTVEAYSPATNTWTTLAGMLTPRASLTAAVGEDGRIYAIGGLVTGAPFPASALSVDAYSITTNSWASVAPMSRARNDFGAARGSDGRLYAIGGSSNSIASSTNEAYTAASNTWATMRLMPTPRGSLAVAPSTDGRIFALGGRASTFLATVEAYSAATNTWTTRASMPVARFSFGAALAPDGRIYVVGGLGVPQNGYNYLASVNAYVPATDTWY